MRGLCLCAASEHDYGWVSLGVTTPQSYGSRIRTRTQRTHTRAGAQSHTRTHAHARIIYAHTRAHTHARGSLFLSGVLGNVQVLGLGLHSTCSGVMVTPGLMLLTPERWSDWILERLFEF